MKITILYFSKTGRTRDMAEEIAAGMREACACEIGLFDIRKVDLDFLEASCAVVFGTPTYYANTCWQIKKWFDASHSIRLAGKLGAAFATADYAVGGADIAIQSLVTHMMVKGMLVYSGGSALGQPFIHLGAVALKPQLEESRPLFRTFGRRIAEQALRLTGAGGKEDA